MALGGKTVNYTLEVNLETGQLSAASKQAAAELGLIKNQTGQAADSFKQFGRDIKDAKQALSLLSGAAILGVVVSQMSQIVGFAQQYEGATKNTADEMERLGRFLKRTVGESKVFEVAMEFALSYIKGFAAVLMTMTNFKSFSENLATLTAGAAGEKTGEELAIKAVPVEIKQFKDTSARDELKAAQELASELADIEKLRRDEVRDSELAKIKIKEMAAKQELAIANDVGKRKEQYLQNELDFYFAAEEEKIRKMEMTEEAILNLKDQMSNIAFNGFIDGFNAIGAALVNGQNAFKSFGSVFIRTLGMLAVQFGSFLIAVGVGMSAVPELFGLKGASAIAAGAALVVLGGALGAFASKIGGSGAGSRSSADREQRFRDSNFGPAGGGGQIINNYVTFQNAIGLDDRSRKEVAEYIGDELFRQNRLGRLSLA